VLGDGIALELPRLLDWRSLLKAHTKVSDCAIVSALEHQTENSYHPLEHRIPAQVLIPKREGKVEGLVWSAWKSG
jgi:hypothetical protein